MVDYNVNLSIKSIDLNVNLNPILISFKKISKYLAISLV